MFENSTNLDLLAQHLRQIAGEGNVRMAEPLAEHTTFKIGGPAELFVTPRDADAVRGCIEACREADAPYFILGAGSNLLVSDDGFEGVIIALTSMDGISFDGCEMTCQAGVLLKDASEKACELGLSGLEFACGIPGTVGGACFMNAGAYGGCMSDVLEEVAVITAGGTFTALPVDALDLSYRHSRLADDGMVVVSATLALTPGDRAEIRAKMDDLTEQRTSKQPLELPSAGSTFKRPEGYFAGKLISDAGLKGFQMGGAAVSAKHAGFVVNMGGATAADVCALIAHVQGEVDAQFGVRLEPEVRMLGF